MKRQNCNSKIYCKFSVYLYIIFLIFLFKICHIDIFFAGGIEMAIKLLNILDQINCVSLNKPV